MPAHAPMGPPPKPISWKKVLQSPAVEWATYFLLGVLTYLALSGILMFAWSNTIEKGFSYIEAMAWIALVALGVLAVQGLVEWVRYIIRSW